MKTSRASVIASFERTTRGSAWEVLFWAAPVLAYFAFPGHYFLLTQMAITGLFALSLDLILGYAGVISLGHAAFFGVGAYTAGILASNGWGDPLLGLFLAGVLAAGLGFLSSFLLVRGSDLSRLMVTLGVALILYEVANRWSSLTGGVDGLPNMDVAPLLGWWQWDIRGRVGYGYAMAVLLVLFLFARRLVSSPFGYGLRGIRMNAQRMPALGVPVRRRLIGIYTLAAAYAGVAGALLAQTHQFVSLEVLGFHRSAELLLVLVLGGAGYLYGGLVGAIVFVLVSDALSGIHPHYWQFWFGLVLVLMVLFARGGILGLVQRCRTRAGMRRAVQRGSAPP